MASVLFRLSVNNNNNNFSADEDINVNRAASTDLLTNKFVAPESHPTVTQALPNKLWEVRRFTHVW